MYSFSFDWACKCWAPLQVVPQLTQTHTVSQSWPRATSWAATGPDKTYRARTVDSGCAVVISAVIETGGCGSETQCRHPSVLITRLAVTIPKPQSSVENQSEGVVERARNKGSALSSLQVWLAVAASLHRDPPVRPSLSRSGSGRLSSVEGMQSARASYHQTEGVIEWVQLYRAQGRGFSQRSAAAAAGTA